MASKSSSKSIQLQPRDYSLFEFLYQAGSATASQVWRASQTFEMPFASLDRAQRRLRQLHRAGWVKRFTHRTVIGMTGAAYFKLSLSGYRSLLADYEAEPPTRRFFEEIAIGKYHHDYYLTEVIVATLRAAQQRGLRIQNFQPQGTFSIEVDGEMLLPDAYYELVNAYGRRFPQCVEIDSSTERRSGKCDRWLRKNRLYDAWASTLAESGQPVPQVQVFTWRSRQRCHNILRRFGNETANPNRILYKGCYVEDFLKADDSLCDAIFADHRRHGVALVPPVVLHVAPDRADATIERPPLQSYAAVLLGSPVAAGSDPL